MNNSAIAAAAVALSLCNLYLMVASRLRGTPADLFYLMMKHILEATKREYLKMEIPVTDYEFKGWL